MKGRKRHASGGKVTEYNAKGSPEMAEAKDTSANEFKRGGKPGGHVGGKKGMKRLDKRARGGGVSPYSSGRSSSAPKSGGKGDGHEGEMPGDVP